MKQGMFGLCVVIAGLLLASPALALETKAKQAIIVDDNTNTVLFEKNADEKMHPSSMSKLMTLYVAFQRLKEGRLKLDDTMPVSEKAWRMQGSKMWVELGARIPVEALLRGIIIQSGNDACIVLAEGLSGSEEAFAEVMNTAGKEMGLTNSHFVNSTGWPDENHLTTARDLSTLAHHLIHDFPEYYHYFAETEFTWHNIKQPNRNLLLGTDLGVDGLKTGHTEQAGYGMVASGKNKDGRRIIVVVNGLTSMNERIQETEALVRTGFRDFENVKLLSKGQEVDKADVWFGRSLQVPLVVAEDMVVNLPNNNRKDITFTLRYNAPIPAPVKAGDNIAELLVKVPGRTPMAVKLAAGADVERLSGVGRILPALSYYLMGK